MPVREPRTSMRTTSTAIGPGLPLGIGAALKTGKPTIVIHGDGGIMLTIAELATAAELGVPLVVCLFNDRGYGILRYMQDMAFGGRRTGVDLATPDFVALARALGVSAARVDRSDVFQEALVEALRSGTPWLLDIDLTDASHGNALGIGLADFTTRRLLDKIDFKLMTKNVYTSGFLERGKIPIVFDTDGEASADEVQGYR